jgi:hypothetical protein
MLREGRGTDETSIGHPGVRVREKASQHGFWWGLDIIGQEREHYTCAESKLATCWLVLLYGITLIRATEMIQSSLFL